MTEILLPLGAALLLVLTFFGALTCFSLREFSRSRLEEICRRHQKEERFSSILKLYEPALLAVELFYTLTVVALAAILFFWFDFSFFGSQPEFGWLALTGEILAVILFLFFVAVIFPWSIARVGGEPFLYRFWSLINGLLTISRPLVSLAQQIDKLLHRLSGMKEPDETEAAIISDEIRTVVDEGQREGLIESQARTMIHRVMELQEEDVSAVMTPRTDMVCIQVDSPLEVARQRMLEAGHSRMPVIGESTDDIIGILYAKDLLQYLEAGNGKPPHLTEIARDPIYVPETTGIGTLLETMKRQRVHMAIVLDEYGGVAGLITMEDILEEIVGDIVDEYDEAEETGIYPLEADITEVDARVKIDDLNEQFDYDLPEDRDYDTIGGFAFSQFGRIPETGESFTWQQLRITVLAVDKRKINRLKIEVDKSLAAMSQEEG